eukprot:jgi/Hompol1/2699/HPOL_003005-RA
MGMTGSRDDQEPVTGDERVLVLGGGNFGTCLADHLADTGVDVTIWARDQQLVNGINSTHINEKYLPGIPLAPSLKATSLLDQATVAGATVILVAIPTQHMRSVLEQIKDWVTTRHLLIFVNKGIEISTGLLPNDVAIQVLGNEIGSLAAFLSGPSFAAEVVCRQPVTA